MTAAVSFTFDDGPDEIWTPLVLEQLARCRARATFFMVGERVLAHPDPARAVLAAGHDVQLHCHRHVRHTEMTEAEIESDAEASLAALRSVGARPRLWRTPWGICTGASARVAERLGLALVRWTLDTHDWRGDSPWEMLVRAVPQLTGGTTVLMHDALGPGARRSGCRNTVELLAALAACARSRELALAPMPHRPRPLALGAGAGVPA